MQNKIIDYFKADWCQPCINVIPLISKLRTDGFIIDEHDIDSDFAKKNKVLAVPAFIVQDLDNNKTHMITGVVIEDLMNILYKKD